MGRLDVARELTERLKAMLGDGLVRVVLFGSSARGDHEPESDIDVLVVVRGDAKASWGRVREAAARLGNEHHPWLELVVLSVEEYNEAARGGRYFINAVVEEGVVLYDDGSGALEEPSPAPSGEEVEWHVMMALESLRQAVGHVGEQDAGLSLLGYKFAFLRAFDAVEHIIRATAKSKGYRRLPKRHGGWRELFTRDFVRTGVIPIELWRRAEEALERRPVVAYEPAHPRASVSRDEAIEGIVAALDLFKICVRHLANSCRLEEAKCTGYLVDVEKIRVPK